MRWLEDRERNVDGQRISRSDSSAKSGMPRLDMRNMSRPARNSGATRPRQHPRLAIEQPVQHRMLGGGVACLVLGNGPVRGGRRAVRQYDLHATDYRRCLP